MNHIMTFCGKCDCGCPELFVDPEALDEAKRFVITDDWGQRIQMSWDQLEDMAEKLPALLAQLREKYAQQVG